MKIYTGNFANQMKYRKAGLVLISIALTARYFSGIRYKALSPEWYYKDYPESSYKPIFQEKLKRLNKQKIIKELKEISGNNDLILLCHEKNGDFCHRHIVNEWLEGEGEFNIKQNLEQKQLSIF